MSTKIIPALYQITTGSHETWNSINPILLRGVAGYVSSGNTKGQLKIGDGKTRWNDLSPVVQGDNDYNNLYNKPLIGGVKLHGDILLSDIGAVSVDMLGKPGGIPKLDENGIVHQNQLPPLLGGNLEELLKKLVEIQHPVGSTYTQYPVPGFNEIEEMFPEEESPAYLYGGTWMLLFNTDAVFFRTEGDASFGGSMARTNGIQEDAIRNATGNAPAGRANNPASQISGVFSNTGQTSNFGSSGYTFYYINFDLSRAFPNNIDTVNHPRNRLIRVWKRIA